MVDTFTTGQIAKYLHVAPRTVSKWVDNGKLKGFKLPLSKDRRVLFDDFVVFCKEVGYPVPNRDLKSPTKIYIYGVSKLGDYDCFDSPFELGRACANSSPRLIVVIENDALLNELDHHGYKTLRGNDMTYNEILNYLEILSNATA